ncbi:hypothetical protein C1N83_27485 (plasmid) [Priestia aryabhattai]|nr:hypothetical protein VL11_02650 [Priestia aryabhattai]KMN93086.1 hypothetical protein ABV89_25960 [Priestia aryabhattai]
MSTNYKKYFYKKFSLIYLITLMLFIIIDIMDSGKISLFSFEDSWNFILYQIIFCLMFIGFLSAFITNLLWKRKKSR